MAVRYTDTSLQTPWGLAQSIEDVALGIRFVSTAGHGGYHLDAEQNAKVPADWRAVSFNQQGLRGWYEEDCDWCMVALTFPEVLTGVEVEIAQKTFDHWIKPKLANAAGDHQRCVEEHDDPRLRMTEG